MNAPRVAYVMQGGTGQPRQVVITSTPAPVSFFSYVYLLYTVKIVMNFIICLLFNVRKLKTGFSKKKSIYFTLEIK